jgi:hypothetical protein
LRCQHQNKGTNIYGDRIYFITQMYDSCLRIITMTIINKIAPSPTKCNRKNECQKTVVTKTATTLSTRVAVQNDSFMKMNVRLAGCCLLGTQYQQQTGYTKTVHFAGKLVHSVEV